MKRSAIICLLFACAFAHAQYDVFDPDGKKSGTASYTMTSAGGKITTKLVIDVSRDGGKFHLELVSVHNSDGDPIEYVSKDRGSSSGSSFTSSSKSTFSGRTATVVTETGARKYTRTITAPGPIKDLSMVWLTGKVPAVGTKSTYYQFNPDSWSFTKHVATYHGLRDITIGGKTVSAHAVTSSNERSTQKIYFSSTGVMYRLESGPLIIVKR